MPNLLQSLARASLNRSARLAETIALLAEARIIELPELGVERSVAQAAVDALRGKTIINEATGIRARLSSSARGKLVSNKATGKSNEAIKLEALDRIVEVVSGNTPHASSAPTRGMVAFFSSCVNAVFGKISIHRSRLAAGVALLLAFASAARADEIEYKGQKVVYFGAAEKPRTVGNDELLLIFKDTASAGSLKVPYDCRVRVLAIAGGGAGGTVRSSATSCTGHPGGGGGGGGEVIELGNKGTRRGNSAPFLFSKDSLTEYG